MCRRQRDLNAFELLRQRILGAKGRRRNTFDRRSNPAYCFGIHTFDFSSSSQLVCLLLGVFGLLSLLVHNLKHSATGRAMYASRSSAVAAQASGISTARAQVALFAVSAVIAGFGGALYGVTTISMTRDTAPPLVGLIS